MTRAGWAVLGVGATVVALAAKEAKRRVRRARGIYTQEVSSGAKPIQAVGTAIAAFVGFDPR